MSSSTTTTNHSSDVAVHVGSAPVKQFPLTEVQKMEIWLASKVSTESNCCYNECTSLLIRGPFDQAAMTNAVQQVVARNEMLRATISPDGELLSIHPTVEIPCVISDWSGMTAEEQQAAREAAILEEVSQPFDLESGPLLRWRIQKLNDNEHLLTFTAHHICMDGWSFWVFSRDLGHLYTAFSQGKDIATVDLPEPGSYEKYAAVTAEYESTDVGKADCEYWLNRFRESIPVLELPVDRPRPMLKTYPARRYDHVIDADLVAGLKKAGAPAGCSLFNVMLAGFKAFLTRICDQDDIAVGIPTAGQIATDMVDLVGHCVNTLPVRTTVDAQQPMIDFAKTVRSDMMDALDHQRFTFGSILRELAPPRDPGCPPIVSVLFNVDPAIDENDLGFEGLEVDVFVEPRAFENFEWFINGVIEDGRVELQCQYNTDLFDEETIAGFMTGYEALLRGFVEQPQSPICELPVLSQPQQQTMFVEWNATELQYPHDSSLAGEFSRQAKATPERIAVTTANGETSFAELDARSNRLARLLQSQGVQSGDLVGVCVSRNVQMVEALLAILKTGAGYVPLDPGFPIERLKYMCDNSGLGLVVTESGLKEISDQFGCRSVLLDEVADECDSLDASDLDVTVDACSIAYVIYTSGSTGKPKGVQVPHGAVVNFLYGMREEPGFAADDCILAGTTLSFDISVLELFLPLVTGGRLFLADAETVKDGARLAAAMEENGVTVFQATPASFRLLLEADWKGDAGLRLLCGGEPMPAELV
ncbi:MAG: condensation domain-containing protein, partial [Planctomycetota bacterium]